MEDSESVLKTVCCICISVDRKLSQLCRVPNGVNNLYCLLSYDTEAYEHSFYKTAANLFVCWECVSLLKKVHEFRNRACVAQKELSLISAGINKTKYKFKCLSALSIHHKSSFDRTFTEPEFSSCYNFVDCGPDIEIKNESDTEEIPLSKVKKETEVLNKEMKVKKQKHAGNKPDAETINKFPCTECDECFDNKNKRYKHVQRCHREWFKCATCNKKFAFKSTLNRHEQLHLGPQPRSQCPTCGKLVRRDLWRTHARTHAARTQYACVACDKRFVSRASYDHHLKYTLPHATHDLLKYKCGECAKGYRSMAELRDHRNYQHLGRTRHKCPICNKALATRRCVTRHVRRAHHGVQERVRNKICQKCGKAFRDAKALREHEWTHTGERPLACAECGRAFRHSAALAAHRRRLHKMAARARPPVALADE